MHCTGTKIPIRRWCRKEDNLAKLKSEFEIDCPCCSAKLVVDANLQRVIRHSEPPSADCPELDDAQKILAEQAARREALFQKSVAEEKNRGDALSRRFEEALRQARDEPITKPTRTSTSIDLEFRLVIGR